MLYQVPDHKKENMFPSHFAVLQASPKLDDRNLICDKYSMIMISSFVPTLLHTITTLKSCIFFSCLVCISPTFKPVFPLDFFPCH